MKAKGGLIYNRTVREPRGVAWQGFLGCNYVQGRGFFSEQGGGGAIGFP